MYHIELLRKKDNKKFTLDFDSPYKAHLYANSVRHSKRKPVRIINIWCDDPYANISQI